MRRHLLRVLASATMLAVALVANARAASWNDAPKVRELYEAARREGKVIIWGTHRREVDWIAAAFGKMFPGIEVEFLGDNDIAVKTIAEARAGRHHGDFWY
jgi:ABC-type glycerol-3-phosphate transport system substrate-binding protein